MAGATPTSGKTPKDMSTADRIEELEARLRKHNGAHTRAEEALKNQNRMMIFAGLAVVGFVAVQVWFHVSDGQKHEVGEQKMNRIRVAIEQALTGKIPPPEVKEKLAEHDKEIKHLLRTLEDQSKALARIEALLEKR
jgi:hypothetical protein